MEIQARGPECHKHNLMGDSVLSSKDQNADRNAEVKARGSRLHSGTRVPMVDQVKTMCVTLWKKMSLHFCLYPKMFQKTKLRAVD